MGRQKVEPSIVRDGSDRCFIAVLQVKSVNFGKRGNGNKSKENYLEATKKARKAVYQVKCVKIGKRMFKNDQGVIGEQRIRNNDGVLEVNVGDRKTDFKSYV